MDPAVAARLHNLYWSIGTVAFIAVGSVLVGWLAMGISRARGLSLRSQRRAFWGYAMAAPWLLGFVIFVLGPAFASLYYSLTDYRLGQTPSWVGLENYQTLLGGLGAHGRRFVQAMYNSFYYAVVGVPLQIVTALLMAMLVARALPGMGIFRLVFYLPVILAGGPAILLAWRYMLASNGGFINLSLKGFAEAFAPFDWLYRSFIFVNESFNAFYAGISRNDPVGPLMYLLPALVGAGLCLAVLLSASATTRGAIARSAAELIGGLVVLVLLSRLVVHGFVLSPELWSADTWTTLGRLVTLQTSVLEPGNLAYLRTGYAAHAPSPMWLLALIAAVMALVAWGRWRPGLMRGVVAVVGAGLFLLSVGAAVDTVHYFKQFDLIAKAAGSVNHHFALFRQVTAQFPDANRVPLWLGSELWSKPSLILITMWSSGAGMLIFLAALKGVPRVFYEAAEVDGATPWQRFWRITLPMISPAMFYNVVIGMIASMQTFEAVYIIQNTQTEQSLASAAYFLFVRTFRQLEIGQGAAASWILAVIIVLLTVVQFRYSRWVHYS